MQLGYFFFKNFFTTCFTTDVPYFIYYFAQCEVETGILLFLFNLLCLTNLPFIRLKGLSINNSSTMNKTVNDQNMDQSVKEIKKHIGRNISKVRGYRGWSQTDLAARMNTSQQYVSKIENSERIEERTLKKFADAIGVTPDYILNLETELDRPLIGHQEIHAKEAVGQINAGNQINHPVDKIIELFERIIQVKDDLLKEKDALLKEKDELIEVLKKHQVPSREHEFEKVDNATLETGDPRPA